MAWLALSIALHVLAALVLIAAHASVSKMERGQAPPERYWLSLSVGILLVGALLAVALPGTVGSWIVKALHGWVVELGGGPTLLAAVVAFDVIAALAAGAWLTLRLVRLKRRREPRLT